MALSGRSVGVKYEANYESSQLDIDMFWIRWLDIQPVILAYSRSIPHHSLIGVIGDSTLTEDQEIQPGMIISFISHYPSCIE